MIEHLRGTVLFKDEERVVISSGGVGYGAEVPARTAAALPGPGGEASLWVKTCVSQDDLRLFGFATRGEREVFEVLLGISGVGPKLALSVLSSFTIEEMIQVVASGNLAALKKIPGVGAKKAEKLMVELKQRLERLAGGVTPERLAEIARGQSGDGLERPLATDAARDAAAALEALDVQPATARRAVAKALEALGEDAGVEALVREALRRRHQV